MASNYEIDKTDKQILALLIEDARMPFTEIAKKIGTSPGTVHGRVKRLEEKNIISGATITIDYEAVGYGFTAYTGIILGRTIDSEKVINELRKIPEVTVAHISSGQFGIFCKLRCMDTIHAKEVIFRINNIEGVQRTETMISLEESLNDKQRLFKNIFEINSQS